MALYLQPCAELASDARAVRFEGGIGLSSGSLPAEVRPGQPFGVALEWTLSQATPAYAVFLHLADETGKPWGQSDGDPVNGLRPFPGFEPGQLVLDCRAVLPAPETPPGRYAVIAGLYRRDTGQRLRLTSGPEAGADAHLIGQVQVRAR